MVDEKHSFFAKFKQLFADTERKPRYDNWLEIKTPSNSPAQLYHFPMKKEPIRNQPRESVRNGLGHTRELTQKRIENEQTEVRDRKQRITNTPRVTTEELKKRYPDAFNSK